MHYIKVEIVGRDKSLTGNFECEDLNNTFASNFNALLEASVKMGFIPNKQVYTEIIDRFIPWVDSPYVGKKFKKVVEVTTSYGSVIVYMH